MSLGSDGRLNRADQMLEMNAYCRRAVSKAVEIGATDVANEVVIFTLGPESADDVLREAIAWGDIQGCGHVRGVHICDAAFAGSDTLATARTLVAALRGDGDFDLILCGRNSIDADTGQVGPQVAELLGIEFVSSAREIALDGNTVHAVGELDDGVMTVETQIPVLISCAERLCEPSKVEPEFRAQVNSSRIVVMTSSELGEGPWGQAASPTRVGDLRSITVERTRLTWPELDLNSQVDKAIAAIRDRHAIATPPVKAAALGPLRRSHGPAVVALIEPGRSHTSAELLGSAAMLAAGCGGYAVGIGPSEAVERCALGNLGADMTVAIHGSDTESDLATTIAAWLREHPTTILLAPSTAWGREIASRIAARTSSGLTGDAIDLELVDGRLVAWKPAFGGAVVAAITSESPLQLVTVRAGVLCVPIPRNASAPHSVITASSRSQLRVLSRTRDDDIDVLADAEVVIGVGRGVDPAKYAEFGLMRYLLLTWFLIAS